METYLLRWAEEAINTLGLLEKGTNPFSDDAPGESDSLHNPQILKAFHRGYWALKRTLPWFSTEAAEMDPAHVRRLEDTVTAMHYLSQGINPFTGERPPFTDSLHNAGISRALSVSGAVLREALLMTRKTERNDRKTRSARIVRFSYIPDLHRQIPVRPYPIGLCDLWDNIRQIYGESFTMTFPQFQYFLARHGILIWNRTYTDGAAGKLRYIPNPLSDAPGVYLKKLYSRGAERILVVCDESGQRYILNLLRDVNRVVTAY